MERRRAVSYARDVQDAVPRGRGRPVTGTRSSSRQWLGRGAGPRYTPINVDAEHMRHQGTRAGCRADSSTRGVLAPCPDGEGHPRTRRRCSPWPLQPPDGSNNTDKICFQKKNEISTRDLFGCPFMTRDLFGFVPFSVTQR